MMDYSGGLACGEGVICCAGLAFGRTLPAFRLACSSCSRRILSRIALRLFHPGFRSPIHFRPSNPLTSPRATTIPREARYSVASGIVSRLASLGAIPMPPRSIGLTNIHSSNFQFVFWWRAASGGASPSLAFTLAFVPASAVSVVSAEPLSLAGDASPLSPAAEVTPLDPVDSDCPDPAPPRTKGRRHRRGRLRR